MKKRLFLAAVIVALSQFCLFSQSFDRITQILDSEKITAGQLSYLAATYMKAVDERADEKAAFDKLKEMGFFAENDSFDYKFPGLRDNKNSRSKSSWHPHYQRTGIH